MNHKELSFLLKNISILYVEDDEDTRLEMSSLLELFTQNLIVAKSGRDALKLFIETKPQLIISDIEMPGISGIEFIKEVRKMDFKIPVILLTAYTDTHYLLPAANLNIQSYLVKPIRSIELKESLFNIIEILNENNSLYIELSDSLKYNKINSELVCDEGKQIKLNKKEKKLVDLLVCNQNRVVTYYEIESQVWTEYDEVMTSMALRTIIKNLRKKISSDVIENISGQGYKLSIK